MKLISDSVRDFLGYSEDKRKRRRQHRKMARKLLVEGEYFWIPAMWHKEQAIALCYK